MSSPSSIQDSALDVGRSAFSSSLFGETLPDIETESAFAEQLPCSTFTPPPVDVAPLDYDEMMAEILRLEAKAQELRIAITRCCAS